MVQFPKFSDIEKFYATTQAAELTSSYIYPTNIDKTNLITTNNFQSIIKPTQNIGDTILFSMLSIMFILCILCIVYFMFVYLIKIFVVKQHSTSKQVEVL
jgi:hypothetical protein